MDFVQKQIGLTSQFLFVQVYEITHQLWCWYVSSLLPHKKLNVMKIHIPLPLLVS